MSQPHDPSLHAPPQRLCHWVLCLLLATPALQPSAHAQPSPAARVNTAPATPSAPAATPATPATICQPNLQSQTPAALLVQLRKIESQCQTHAPFLYSLGYALNQSGNYNEAIDPLESALLYRPEHWPTQLEYAIALQGIGDRQSALNLIASLGNNPAVDRATRQQLLALQHQPSPAPASTASAASTQRGKFSITAGHESNLLSSTHHSQFNLTTPNGALTVQLDPDQRPRAGFFIRTDISRDWQPPANPAPNWRYTLAGSYRSSPGFKAANYSQIAAQVEYTAATATNFSQSQSQSHGPYLLARHQMLARSAALVLQQTQLSAGYDFSLPLPAWLGHCQQRLGLDAQHTRYPTSPVLNSHYTGITTTANCPTSGLQVQLRAGQERPADPAKPGGSQHQFSLRASQRMAVGNAALTLELETTHQHDQSGYSPLLLDNAKRRVQRTTLKAEYRWTTGTISPYIGLEAARQRANLSLFEFKNQAITLGFSSRW